MKRRATELGSSPADCGHARLCPACYAGSALPNSQGGLQNEIRYSGFMTGTATLGMSPFFLILQGLTVPLSPSPLSAGMLLCLVPPAGLEGET